MLVPARDWRFESSLGHRVNEMSDGPKASELPPAGGSLAVSRGRVLPSLGHRPNKMSDERSQGACLAQLVRAPRLHRGGPRFESLSAHRKL